MRISGTTAAAIAASLEKQLHSGLAGADDPLPTVRALAATLRVSPATVAAAYQLLRARGLVVGRGRRGTRVVSAPGGPAQPAASPPAAGIDLATGNPDPSLLPSIEAALRGLTAPQELYAAAPDRALVAFAAGEFEADGIPSRAIAVLGGALDAIERVLREHARAGDRVGVEDPSFPGLLELISASGLVPVPMAMDAEGPLPEGFKRALAQNCRAVIVTPRAQNPTGAAIGASRGDALRLMLRRHPDAVLIENDYLSAVAGVPATTLYSSAQKAWVVIRSTSKFLGPDLRVAVMAGDPVTVARVQGRQALGARWVSHILQRLAVTLWSDPAGGRRLARAADVYASRRAALADALSVRGIHVAGRSGFNLWLPTRDEAHLVRALADRGWAVAPGAPFRIQAPPAIRITTSTLVPDDAARLAADVAESLDRRTAAPA